jgi:predicted ArsR family transcriptional regulator
MDSQQRLIEHLKINGPNSINELITALGLSRNAIKHHLAYLEKHAWLETNTRARDKTGTSGRPAVEYALNSTSEHLFPKRYPELLEAILSEAQAEGILKRLLSRVADGMVKELEPHLGKLRGRARLLKLLEQIDYGEMLPELEAINNGWELRAHNCVYRATGMKFEPVCDLLPHVIEGATGWSAERPTCQRDGARACHFVVLRDAHSR